jgi:N-acetylmuramoyl-L-alanine amidase
MPETVLIMKKNFKKTLKNVSFMILILKICFVFGQKKIVVIDAGHGGIDSGALGVNRILEKDVVLNIAKEIVRLNKTILDNELDIYLTRYKDTLISLSERPRLAGVLKADVFVSIHCNAAKTVAGGMEVFIHNSKDEALSANLHESAALGSSILIEGTQNLKLKCRGVKFANFQVLRETISFCPSVLVETGFVTNVDEAGYFIRNY